MNKAYLLIFFVILSENNSLCCNQVRLKLEGLKMQLFEAILVGDLDKVKYLVEREDSCLKLEDDKREKLDSIVFDGCLYEDKVEEIIFISRCIHGFMPIHVAALAGKLDIFRYFVEERKIDINIEYKDSLESSVFIAASNGKFNIVEYCLSKGQDINAKSNSRFNFFKKTLLERSIDKNFSPYCLINWGAEISENNLEDAKKLEDKEFYDYMLAAINFNLNSIKLKKVQECQFKGKLLNSIVEKGSCEFNKELSSFPCKRNFCDVNIRFF